MLNANHWDEISLTNGNVQMFADFDCIPWYVFCTVWFWTFVKQSSGGYHSRILIDAGKMHTHTHTHIWTIFFCLFFILNTDDHSPFVAKRNRQTWENATLSLLQYIYIYIPNSARRVYFKNSHFVELSFTLIVNENIEIVKVSHFLKFGGYVWLQMENGHLYSK